MKKLLASLLGAAVLLSLCSCRAMEALRYRNMPEIFLERFEQSNNLQGIIYQGQKYLRINVATYDVEQRAGNKFARYKDKGKTLFLSAIDGYDSFSYILVQELTPNMLNIGYYPEQCVYANESVKEIPIELTDEDFLKKVEQGVGRYFDFSGKQYFYYGLMPEGFEPGDMLGTASDNGQVVDLFAISDKPSDQWICGREPGFNGQYRMFCAADISSIPIAYYLHSYRYYFEH